MTLDDIRRLNIREVGNWPLLPRAALLLIILIVIVALGAYLVWKDQYEALDRSQQEEAKLKEQYATKKAKAINYDIYVQQLKEIEQSFGALLKQLPNKAEMDALLTDINQAGLGRGLQFELFKPAAQERMAEFYAELPIAVKITGNYHDMGAFASDVAQLPRIVTLNDIAINNDKGVLTLDAVAKTFPLSRRGRAREAAQGGEGCQGQGGEEMKRWLALSLGASVLLAGCGGESHQDLRAWMADQGKGARGRVDPLPQIKPYEPFAYNAFDLPDPFKPRKIEPTKGAGSKLAPDLTRRREPLEAYPLESLNMVGTLTQGKSTYALVRTPDKDVYQVTTGNYLGQNFGVILGITEARSA
jgi:type IV pilus assembly protein PilO